jgi:hypothetical protein
MIARRSTRALSPSERLPLRREQPMKWTLWISVISRKHIHAACGMVLLMVSVATISAAEDDIFQQAINYVFLGNVKGEPFLGIRIISADKNTCAVVQEEMIGSNSGYVVVQNKFFLKKITAMEFKPFTPHAALAIEGDETIVERIDSNRRVTNFKHWQIPLPGNVERSRRAVNRVFSEYCMPEKRMPF